MPRPRYQTVRLKRGIDHWYIRPWVDVIGPDGRPARRKKQITLGRINEIGKREATKRARETLADINRASFVVQSQVRFGAFLDHWLKAHVQADGNLAASTQAKYEAHARNHVRPAFGELMLCEVTTEHIDAWLAEKATAGLSWATRTDLRNIMSAIFSKAQDWGYQLDRNPAERVTVGRRRPAREQRNLTTNEIRRFFAALHDDVRLILMMALFCTLRISEVLGLQWQDIDLDCGVVRVRRRWYRGDLDTVKSARSARDLPLGSLADELRRRYPGIGHDEDFVFAVRTCRGLSRDDRDINQHFLRPVAKALGIYRPGFGFHTFRRQAVTALNALCGDPQQVQRMAGHATLGMTAHYTLADMERQRMAVEKFQGMILGTEGEGKVQ